MLSTNAFKSSACTLLHVLQYRQFYGKFLYFLLRAVLGTVFCRLYSTSTDARYLYFVSCSAIHVFKSSGQFVFVRIIHYIPVLLFLLQDVAVPILAVVFQQHALTEGIFLKPNILKNYHEWFEQNTFFFPSDSLDCIASNRNTGSVPEAD